MSDESENPFSKGSNGQRDGRGRFVPGWRGGPGNPGSKLARQLRQTLDEALFTTCSRDRLLVAIDAVLRKAEAGDVAALKLLLERIAGPPQSRELAERLDALEQFLEEREATP